MNGALLRGLEQIQLKRVGSATGRDKNCHLELEKQLENKIGYCCFVQARSFHKLKQATCMF